MRCLLTADADAAAAAAEFSCLLLMLLLLLPPPGAAAIDSRFGESVQQIAARCPYKFVREAVLAAAGETKVIVCSFDSEFSVSEGWRSTFYSPVSWYVYSPAAGREVPIEHGAAVRPGDSGPSFVYRVASIGSAVPSSLLVMESVPLHLTGNYYICRTSLRPASVMAFYLKVIKPVLSVLRPSTDRLPATIGSRLRLRCRSGSSFPPASVHWTRRRKHRPLSEQHVLGWGQTYEVASVTAETVDYVYTCHTNNNVEPERSVSYEIELTSSRNAAPGEIAATYNGVQAAFRHSSSQASPQYLRTFTASCRTRGEGVSFRWFRNSSLLEPYADPNLYVFTTIAGEYTVSDLIIRKFRLENRGVYECEATNGGGSRRFSFLLDKIADLPKQLTGSSTAAPESAPAAPWDSQLSGSGWQQHYGEYDADGEGESAGGYYSGDYEAPDGDWQHRRVL